LPLPLSDEFLGYSKASMLHIPGSTNWVACGASGNLASLQGLKFSAVSQYTKKRSLYNESSQEVDNELFLKIPDSILY
jgi:hypothetical protein